MFMDFLNIISPETRGMSIYTALVFLFICLGFRAYFWWDKREHTRISGRTDEHAEIFDKKIKITDEKVDLLFQKVDDTNNSLTEIKTHVARTHEAVEWIKRYMESK